MDVTATEKDGLLHKTYTKIYEEISKENYAIGTKLQPLRAIAKKYNVSYLTAQKAVKLHQIQGVLEARPGDGIYVVGKPKHTIKNITSLLQNSSLFENNGRTIKKNCSICVITPYWITERGGLAIHAIIKGLLSESDKHNWSIELLHNSGDESDNEPSHPQFIKKIDARHPDGVIWLQPIPTHRMNIMRLIDKGYKVVITGRHFKDIPAKSIQIDLQDMAEKIIADLSTYDPKEMKLLTGPLEGVFKDPYSVDIVNAIKHQLTAKGIELSREQICQAGFSQELPIIIENYLKVNPDTQAIICLHEHILSCLENLVAMGRLDFDQKIPLIDISGIFNFKKHHLKNFDIKQVHWPLENIGKAVINEFEKEWINEYEPVEYDLKVEIYNTY